MIEKESKLLSVGDNVVTTELPPGETHYGKVLETNWMAIKIGWDDGQTGIVDHRGMEKIAKREG